MERKFNAITKHKWRSQPDLGLMNGATIDHELHNFCVLSGVNFDFDVFQIIIDLLRLNVNPNTILDVLKKMANQSAMQSKGLENGKKEEVGNNMSDNMASYTHMASTHL